MGVLEQLTLDEMSAALAVELASDMHEAEQVFARHGYTMEEAQRLLAQPWFQSMVRQAKRDWDSLENAKERIRVKAQLSVEESIVTLHKLIADEKMPASARVLGFKEMKEIAGLSAKTQEGGGSLNVVPVQIFLNGRDAPPVDITPTVTPRVTSE